MSSVVTTGCSILYVANLADMMPSGPLWLVSNLQSLLTSNASPCSLFAECRIDCCGRLHFFTLSIWLAARVTLCRVCSAWNLMSCWAPCMKGVRAHLYWRVEKRLRSRCSCCRHSRNSVQASAEWCFHRFVGRPSDAAGVGRCRSIRRRHIGYVVMLSDSLSVTSAERAKPSPRQPYHPQYTCEGAPTYLRRPWLSFYTVAKPRQYGWQRSGRWFGESCSVSANVNLTSPVFGR